MPTSFISNNQHPAITINKTKIKSQLQNPSMNGVPLTKGKGTTKGYSDASRKKSHYT